MKMSTLSSLFVLMSVVSMIAIAPSAFADQTITNAVGSETPGCEPDCFIPSTATVEVGAVVTWDNTDGGAAHTASAGNPTDGPSGVWDSSLIMAGQSYSYTADTAGTFDYYCMVHPWMEGTVIVEAAGAADAAEAEAAAAAEAAAIPDTTKPIISPPADLVIEATGSLTSVELGEAIAIDENGIQILVNNAPTLFPLGSSTIIWTAIDNGGNSASAIQQVSIVDTTPPIIHSVHDIIAEAVVPYDNIIELQEPSADDLLGVISITNDAPEFFPIGETIVTWIATDVGGNTDNIEQKITVVDTTFPTLQVPADVVTEATSLDQNEVNLGEATSTDNGEIVSITNDAPEFFPIGETVVTWTTIDSSNNFSSLTQLVSVIDTTAPEILLLGDMTLEASSVDANIVNLDSPIVSDIQDVTIYIIAPDVFPVGETTVTWTATDTSGNSASATQIVTIVDTTSPELTMPEDVMISAFSLEKQVEIGEAQAHDLAGSALTITNDAPDIFPLGDTIVTWNVSDELGNSSSSQQVISVQPCGKPLSYYNQIFGTPAADTIVGTEVADLIFAFAGDDMIFGGEGNDCIIGGDGDDLIFGNAGDDHLVGGEGNDILKGFSGDDKLTGGTGTDVLDGGDDFDVSYNSVSDIIIKCEEQL